MSTGAISAPAARRLARFELLRELGRGAQASVWLAHDPRLDREVAIKLLDPGADAASLNEWLHEARAVSRLSHANIVPVFEADVGDAAGGRGAPQPYLVFEYVEGPTLSQARAARPKWPAREAVQLVMGVLDALAAAHEQGIVHRDLKPSNILLGTDGRPRVMDFGIAARVQTRVAASDGRIVGTPGYMSPEAARAEPPHPSMDVFAAGVMLGELLAGMPLLRERDPWRAVERVQKEDLVLPEDVRVDGTLRGIVQRAIARDARQRYDGARSMHAALKAWLEPEEAPTAESTNATLEFLLRKMRHKTDFPALSDSVLRIQRVASSDKANTMHLADEILRDVALTNKLLRMVNSVHFTAVAGGNITTISRAVSLVGFAGIRNMALAVLLLEHMGDKSHASLLKEEFARSLMAGTLAAELVTTAREAEEAFLGSMFQNLGRLLVEYYFPEEALHIRQSLAGRADTRAARDAAALKVIGIGLDELGAGVAKAWGLPEDLQRAMRHPEGELPNRALPRGIDRMRWLGSAAASLTDTMIGAGAGDSDAVLAEAERWSVALSVSASDIVSSVQTARGKLTQMASAMGLHLPRGGQGRKLMTAEADTIASDDAKTVVAPRDAAATEATLSQALDEATRAMADKSLRLNELLHLVLDTIHRALGFRGVVFCLRDPRSGALVGRFALGNLPAPAFRIVPGAGQDLFAVLASKGADLLIADAAPVAAKLPAWYREKVNAPTFLLLPLVLNGAPIGLIYADRTVAKSITLSEREMALVRGLRDKLTAAFTRGSG